MIRKCIEILWFLLSELEALFVKPTFNLRFRKRYLKSIGVFFEEPLWIGRNLIVHNGNNLKIGQRCALGNNTTIIAHVDITIGEDFICADGLHLDSGGHDPVDMSPVGNPIHIGNRVWCGLEVKILAGVTIGDDVVIGAGSVVCDDISAGSIAVGLPAKVIKQLDRQPATRLWTWASHKTLSMDTLVNKPESPLLPDEDVVFKSQIACNKLIQGWKEQFDIDISDELKGIKEIKLYETKSTKLHFFVPDISAGSSLLYEKLQKFEWYYMDGKWEHARALSDLHSCSQVLEVGAANGNFVREAVNRGIDILGIDVNEAAIRKARGDGLPVEKIELETLCNEKSNSFDGICSFQVLEHIADPGKFIESLVRLLKPGGILILSVPNRESFIQHQYILLDTPPHHMTRWSIDTFKALEKVFPITLKSSEFEPLADYHVPGFIDAYYRFFRKNTKIPKIFINQTIFKAFGKLLSLTGVRKRFKGQTLYVVMEKKHNS